MKEHSFTAVIRSILSKRFSENSGSILERSDLLHYINIKTGSAAKGSKARGSFGNLYANLCACGRLFSA